MLIQSYFSGVEDFDLVFDLKEKNKIKIWHLVGVSEIAVAAAAVAVNTHQKISLGFARHIRNVVDEFLDDRGRGVLFSWWQISFVVGGEGNKLGHGSFLFSFSHLVGQVRWLIGRKRGWSVGDDSGGNGNTQT